MAISPLCVAHPSHAAPANAIAISPIETRVLGPSVWQPGARSALRVIVTDHMTQRPVRGSINVSIVSLKNGKPDGKSTSLFRQQTDKLGTLNARFLTPKLPDGPCRLTILVDSSIGTDTVEQDIQIRDSQQVLLTCDKPVYQPGQTIHLRALALDMATRTPLSGSKVTFEVEDARGNKVFKSRAVLSRFGVAGTDFVLADEVNMGTFHLRAVLPSGEAEKTVRVERYVLPKFRVAVSTAKDFYLPGETAHGTLDAKYFFGKPVAGAHITLTVNTIDIGTSQIGTLDGITNAEGHFEFDYKMPDHLVGQPFEQGKAVVEFAADVKDTANHTEHGNRQVPVVPEPVLLSLVPEHSSIVAGVENQVYVAAARADGTPLRNATILLSATPADGGKATSPKQVKTDSLGLASYRFTPQQKQYTVQARYSIGNGHEIAASQILAPMPGEDGILLRTDETFAKVGERVKLTALSTRDHATIYFDIVRDGQTILTQAQDSRNGTGSISLPISDDMVGTLQVHAYTILPTEDIIRDTRTIIVAPADDLNVKITADHGQYKPGDDAILRFAVTGQNRQPVAAALGVAIVDESVFALSELQPGLEKIYFTLEKELMQPRYEVHGLTPVGMYQEDDRRIPDASRQRAGAMLLAAVDAADPFGVRTNSFQTRWAKVKEAALAEMTKTRQRIAEAVAKYEREKDTKLKGEDSLWKLYSAGYLKASDLQDPWQHPYKTPVTGDQSYSSGFLLSSSGPDGKWKTYDDLTVSPWGGFAGAFDKDGIVAIGGIARRGMGGGGFGGGIPPPAPMAGAQNLPDGVDEIIALQADNSLLVKATPEAFQVTKEITGSAEPRIRQYFPETLYWNPSVISDDNGMAEVRLPLADSITTWRVSAMANNMEGLLGSATAPVKVFQDFFADIDLPVTLTQGDHVDVPVSLYNYLPEPQDVTVTLASDPWFELGGPATQNIHLNANQVSVVYFPISAREIGSHSFLVTARGSKLSDALKRSVQVLPNGKEERITISDRLEGVVDRVITIPEEALPNASNLWIKLYPGTFSQVVEGLDGLLRMPGGCFEQTSSTTYPNVLVLTYLKQNKKTNPEIQLKAEQYINAGYQRLVTFECKSGGFSWFGNEPAHQVLTAYGLLEFSDMAKVHDVDPALISRTQSWLAGKQNADGSWLETNQGIAEGIINRQSDKLRTTAYVAWALAESGYGGPQVASGAAYVRSHLSEATDPYTQAVILNLLSAPGMNDSATAASVAQKLIASAKTTDKTAYWVSDTKTFTGAEQAGADLETTALAAYALLKWGREGSFVNKVLTYLVQSKDSYGTWSTTQGTVWALKALLFAGSHGTGDSHGTVDVTVNGEAVASITMTPDNSDVMQQIDATKQLKAGDNAVHLSYRGTGSLLYQVVGRFYAPWTRTVQPDRPTDILALSVDYDKTTLALNDTATATITIKNNTNATAEMPLIDVGVPPGFDVISDGLDQAVKDGQISKYTIAARQIIIYMEKLDPNATVSLKYGVKARFPVKALTPFSKAYPYYNPGQVVVAKPQQIEVTKAL